MPNRTIRNVELISLAEVAKLLGKKSSECLLNRLKQGTLPLNPVKWWTEGQPRKHQQFYKHDVIKLLGFGPDDELPAILRTNSKDN